MKILGLIVSFNINVGYQLSDLKEHNFILKYGITQSNIFEFLFNGEKKCFGSLISQKTYKGLMFHVKRHFVRIEFLFTYNYCFFFFFQTAAIITRVVR